LSGNESIVCTNSASNGYSPNSWSVFRRTTSDGSRWHNYRCTRFCGRKTPIRSLKPREVIQEIYGWLLGHYAVRCLMFQAAQQAGISPLRLGFTGTLKVIRRAISDFQDVPLEELPFFFTKLITDILAEKIPPRIGRSNPRVVKKPRSKFSSKQPIHRHTGSTRQRLNFFISNIQRRGSPVIARSV